MPLLQDEKEAGAKEDQYEFEEGQNAISKMMHLIHNQNTDMWYTLMLKFKKIFLKGGPQRMKHTLPALIFGLFKLSSHIEQGLGGPLTGATDEDMQLIKVDQSKIFKSVHELILALQEPQPALSMKLYLQACQAINRISNYQACEDLAYEFASQALLIYQDDISDSDVKLNCITLICSTLFHLNCFSEENQATLIANAMSSCAQLLKKPAQCEAVIQASHLHNS